jgi:hypothetical protein
VVAIDRNGWSASIGIGGRDQSEMAVGISRNMQVVPKLYNSCLYRIFGTLSKVFYISFANPKIFRLDLGFIIFEKPASDNRI